MPYPAPDYSLAIPGPTPRLSDALQRMGTLADLAQQRQLRGVQLQGAQMQNQQLQENMRQTQILNDAVAAHTDQAGTTDHDAVMHDLASKGAGKDLIDYRTKLSTMTKSQSELEEQRVKTQLSKFDLASRYVQSANDPVTWDQARQVVAKELGPQVAQNMGDFSPDNKQRALQAAMNVKDHGDYMLKLAQDQREAAKFNAEMPGIQAKSKQAVQEAAMTPEQRGLQGNLAYQAAGGSSQAKTALDLETQRQMQVARAAAASRQEATDEKTTTKRYETAQDAEQRLSRMEASYRKALGGDQQAMLALLTDHIGMTLGLQKGARITKDILNEATASQPWLQKVASRFDSRGYLSGVTLGKDQMAQMLDLGYEARDRSVQGAFESSQLYGVQPPKGAAAVFGKRQIGAKPALQNGGGVQVTDPRGVVHTFQNQALADAFKREAGIR